MSRTLMFSAIGVILFSLAAGLSWYLQFSQHPEETAKAEDDKDKSKTKAKDPGIDKPLVRAPLSPDADRLTTLAATLQSQQQALKNREQQLATREKELDLVHEEIKKEQKKVESVRKQVDAEMQLVQEKLDLLEKRSAEGEKDHQKILAEVDEARRMTVELSGVESKNLKQMAGIYDKMDPEAAAQSLQQMVEKGKIDTAVTILASMKERTAATLLNAMDSSTGNMLCDRIRYLKMPTGTQK